MEFVCLETVEKQTHATQSLRLPVTSSYGEHQKTHHQMRSAVYLQRKKYVRALI